VIDKNEQLRGEVRALRKQRTFTVVAFLTLVACATECKPVENVCAGLGVELRLPADTTVALHQSIVLAAGSGGTCAGLTSPVEADALTHWQAGDSSIVSVTALDSLHARIDGLGLGTTIVMASWNGIGTSSTLVTVR
jgi:hypothetical protein